MKKRLLAVVMALFSIALVFGGGSQEEASGSEIELSLFFMLDLADEVVADTWDILVEEFERQNPGITIEGEYLASEAYHTKLQALAVSGQLPDVIYLWPGKRTASVTDKGLVKDLRPWLEGKEEMFVPGTFSSPGPNGEIWELPESINATHVLYTNERLLKELGLSFPSSYEELLEQGKKINEAGYIPIAMSNGDGWQMQSCFLSTMADRMGGREWYDSAIKGQGAAFDDAEFVSALKIVKDLYDNDMFSPGLNQAGYGSGLNEFVNEQAVFYIDGGWRVNNMTNELTEEQKAYMTLNVLPDIKGQKGVSGTTSAVPATGFGMNANLEGARAEAAWKWIWFYSGPEGSAIRQQRGATPAYILADAEYNDPMNKKLTDFMAGTPAAYVLDSRMDGEGMGLLQSGLQEMMLGSKTAEEVAREFEAWVSANDSNRK